MLNLTLRIWAWQAKRSRKDTLTANVTLAPMSGGYAAKASFSRWCWDVHMQEMHPLEYYRVSYHHIAS